MPGYDPQTCYNSLLEKGLHPCPDGGGSLSYHCLNISGGLHSICVDQNPYAPLSWSEVYNINKCGPNDYHDGPGQDPSYCEAKTFASYDQMLTWIISQPNCSDYGRPGSQCNWGVRPCACCCACYAWGTQIMTPNGEKVVQDFSQGDEVFAASVTPGNGQMVVTWQAKTVGFSGGTPPPPKGKKTYPQMVSIAYQVDDKVSSDSFVSSDIDPGLSQQTFGLLKNPTIGLIAEDGTVNSDLVAETDVETLASMLQLNQSQAKEVKQVLLSAGQKQLICTHDELFLLASGKLKQAGQLTVSDQLVAPDGNPVPINTVGLVEYAGGIQHIATTPQFNGHADGHLLNSNGVITGDYTLQIHADQLGDLLETGPGIGSSEYHQTHQTAMLGKYTYKRPTFAEKIVLPPHVKLYTEATYIPAEANTFVTQAQGIDILSNATVRPFGNQAGVDSLQDLFKAYNAYYPDIEFYLDWSNANPTAYAFSLYGKKHVVVSGGLIRVDGLYWQGQAVVLAQAVAAFYQPEGQPQSGLLPCVEADYYGVKIIMRIVFPFNYTETAQAGLDQIQTFFSYISPDNAKGDPQNPLTNPSITCRETTMTTAFHAGNLPPCAGGPPVHIPLMVAYAQAGSSPSDVTVVFTAKVDKSSAEDVSNYLLTPEVEVKTATVDTGNFAQVLITADMKPDTPYLITVNNVTSADGSDLDPVNNYANFTSASDGCGK